jgi:FixJ family two-component response regulator
MKVFSFPNNQEFLALQSLSETDKRLAMLLKSGMMQKQVAYSMGVSMSFVRRRCYFLENLERIFKEIKGNSQENPKMVSL